MRPDESDDERTGEVVTVSYGPGASTALATDGVWLVVDPTPSDASIADLWKRLQMPADTALANDVEALFTGNRLGRGFVLVETTDDTLLVVIGGEGAAEVSHGDVTERLTCPMTVATSRFRLHEMPSRIVGEIGSGEDGALLPLSAGVVPAGRLYVAWRVELLAAKEGAETNWAPLPQWEPVPDEEVEAAPPYSEATMAPYVAADGATLAAPDEADLAVMAGVNASLEEHTEQEPAAGAAVPADAVGLPDADSGYDFLFGNTMHRSVGAAAVRPAHDDADSEAVPGPSNGPATDRDQAIPGPAEVEAADLLPRATFEPAPVVHAKTSGMIDSVPWVSSEGPDGVAVPPSADLVSKSDQGAVLADAEGPGSEEEAIALTMSRSRLKELAAEASSKEAARELAPQGPAVHAVRCPGGHPNPAHADVCRVCGAPVADQMPVTVPRPVLGVLRFSTGDVITLDRGVLIGRKPSKTRSIGDNRPHVVKIPSPDQDISREHVEIRLVDWHVLVTDLNSTNGTMVTRPEQQPERLRPDQATQIEPGTVVTLADVVTFTFEATS